MIHIHVHNLYICVLTRAKGGKRVTYKFTNSSKKAIEISNQIAVKLGHRYVGTEHLLYGLVKEGTGIANKVLENQNVVAEVVKEKVEELIGKGEIDSGGTSGFTPRTKRVLENAFREAKKLGSDYIGTEHLLIGMMREGDSIAVRIMLDLNVNPQKLYNEIVKVINEYESGDEPERVKSLKRGPSSYTATPTLNQFGKDLTKEAAERKVRSCYWKRK